MFPTVALFCMFEIVYIFLSFFRSDDEGIFEINAAVIDMQLLNTTGTPPHFKINLNFDNFKVSGVY